MELNSPTFHKLRREEIQAGLPDGEQVDPGASLAKQNSQDRQEDSAKSNKRGSNEKISQQNIAEPTTQIKEFFNSLHSKIQNHSDSEPLKLNLANITSLLKLSKPLSEEHNFIELHQNLEEHHDEINKHVELNEIIDLNHSHKDETLQNKVLNLLNTIFEKAPDLKAFLNWKND